MGQGTVQTSEGVKSVAQKLLLLQDEVRVLRTTHYFPGAQVGPSHCSVLPRQILLSLMCIVFVKLKLSNEEKKKTIENYTSERTLRKKYYNMVEDLKG